jgi:hypothetical protein
VKARRREPLPPASGSPKAEKSGAKVFPHELRAGDVITDEHGDEWKLVGQPSKSVGTQDFVTTVRRVDRPADIREARWRAHERVRVRQT